MSSYSAVIGRVGSPPGGATDMKNYLARPLAIGAVAFTLLTGTTTFGQSLSELSLEDLMRLDAGRVFGASERQSAGHRGTGVGVVHHGRRDRPLRLPDARRHPARRARHVRERRPQLQLSGRPRLRQARRLQQPHPAARQRSSRQRQRLRPGRDRRRVRPRPGDVRARRDHPRPGVLDLRRQRVLRRRQRHHARPARRSDGSAVASRPARIGTQMVRGMRRDAACRTASTTPSRPRCERSDGVARLYFPEFDSPETNNGVAEGLDGERFGQFYGRLALQASDVHRRLRPAAQGRADRVVRHAVQRAGSNASRRPIGTRCSTRSTRAWLVRHASDAARRPTIASRTNGVYPYAGDALRRARCRRIQRCGRRCAGRVGGRMTRPLPTADADAGRRVHRQRRPEPDVRLSGDPAIRSFAIERLIAAACALRAGRDQARRSW